MEGREPKVAFVAILNKKNHPIVLKNFLVDAIRQNYTDLSQEEISSLDLQMKMLVYQTLDHFEEKQKIKGAQVQAPKQGFLAESTYQGLIIEAFVSQYQLDVYGYISNTNYKYIIIKNETKTTPLGQKPADDQVKGMFKSLLRVHTELLLNPFFEPSEGGGVDSELLECYDEDDEDEAKEGVELSLSQQHGNQRYTDVLLHKINDTAIFYEKYF
ncbi:hypothetical protein FGO68_gene9672 [Halteria grandinella]|uniref:Uncharacterized protein n=1 Tax=Halteria grandinella TaxID=5974 RepID=A0A8J8SZI3_HALGN|nr:hypothetical protein FGO68_gene9672 [Halteria grandinella]